MINLAQREVDILGALKDFQRATVERVVDCFRRGQSRVLVADEVGLGKTLIAKGVIASMAHWRHQEGLEEDGVFRVVYIVSCVYHGIFATGLHAFASRFSCI